MTIEETARQLVIESTERTPVQIPRALIVSVAAAIVDVLLYTGLFQYGRIIPEIAATISYLAGGIVQWYACSRWVFKDKRNAKQKGGFADILFFYLLSLVGLVITVAVIYVLHRRLMFHPLLAKFAALGLAFIWNFLSRKFLIFEKKQV
jgi:putative flippase GtrA